MTLGTYPVEMLPKKSLRSSYMDQKEYYEVTTVTLGTQHMGHVS